MTEEEIAILEKVTDKEIGEEAEAQELDDELERFDGEGSVGELEKAGMTGEDPTPARPYSYDPPAQLMIPTMTADDKVGLISAQTQQVERLVAIMLEVLGVRNDRGEAPYDLWNKALEPAEDALVILQGVVKLLKTRNTRRY